MAQTQYLDPWHIHKAIEKANHTEHINSTLRILGEYWKLRESSKGSKIGRTLDIGNDIRSV